MKGSRPAMPALPDDLALFWFLVRRVSALMDRSGEALFRTELNISLAQGARPPR